MPNIFISYRRADTGDLCDRLATRLRWAFGEDAIFRDVNTILAGSSFPDALREGIAACPVMLVVIGSNWLAPVGSPPHRRIDEPDDWVRAEIATALRLGHLVIPVLAPGAPNLAFANLPPDLAPLASFIPLPLRSDPFFDDDTRTLTSAVRPYTDQGPASWFLLVGGALLALVSLILMFYNGGNGGAFLSSLTVPLLVVNLACGVALGSFLFQQALSRHQWGWLAAGVVVTLCGFAQLASLTPDTETTALVVVVILIDYYISPLAAGLCLIAGWIGPREARAPDTLRIRWSSWHTAQAILLALSTVALALIWIVFPSQIFSNAAWLFPVFYGAQLLLPLLLTVTAVIASAHAFVFHQMQWGAGAVIIGSISFLAALISVIIPFVTPLISPLFLDAVDWARVVCAILPIAFLIYALAWLTSYASRTPAGAKPAVLTMERAR